MGPFFEASKIMDGSPRWAGHWQMGGTPVWEVTEIGEQSGWTGHWDKQCHWKMGGS